MVAQSTAVAAWYNEGLIELQDCQLQMALVGVLWPRKASTPSCVRVFLCGRSSIRVGKDNDEGKTVLLPGEHSQCWPGKARDDQPSLEVRGGSGNSKLSICSPVTVTFMLFMAGELSTSSHLGEELRIHMHVMRGGQ